MPRRWKYPSSSGSGGPTAFVPGTLSFQRRGGVIVEQCEGEAFYGCAAIGPSSYGRQSASR
jgi:hypothetical protein